jgi:hypothetical protein
VCPLRARAQEAPRTVTVSQENVANGGGISLLAQTLGHARLAEPVRFRKQWEQEASLRLRDGDTTVLAEYNQHGRIIGETRNR